MPPPPPPYSWVPEPCPDRRLNIFTISAGNQIIVPPDSKLPKYEEIFPAGPPTSDDVYHQHFDVDSRSLHRQTSQDSIITIERY